MFKLALALCVVAALATPVIELELDQAGLRARGSRFSSEKQANTAKVHECQAKTSSASRDCALPKASAYDHHEGDLTGKIQRVLTLVSSDAGVCKKNCKKNSINYNKRSEYVVKYDVKDKSGNAADQVVFAVVLTDYQKPKFNFAGLSFTRECKKSTTTVPKPTATDNIDGSVAVKINGRSSVTQSLKYTKESKTYSYWTTDKAGMFGKNGRNNVATDTKVFTVRDTTKPILTDLADYSVECKKNRVHKNPLTKCSDACDETKNAGVCIGNGRRNVKIAGTYSQFNTGTASGCEHRHHYLYEYKGSDCIWTSNKQRLRQPHAFQAAFVQFQMAEYGNLEDSDFLLIQLKFYGSKGTTTKWLDTVKLQDDVKGWRWTTVNGAPVNGYFNGNKDWTNTYASMMRDHEHVQVRVTLKSDQDFAERHILDNMQVFASECSDYFYATRTTKFNVHYTCRDHAGLSATPTTTRVTIKDTTKPTIKVDMAYQTYLSKGTWNGKIYTHHGGKSGRGFNTNQHNSFSCSDSCCKDVKETHSWVKSCSDSTKASWNELKPGTYYHKFTCTDCNGHSTSECRTVVNEDKWVPIISLLGNAATTLEATHDKAYIDAGATCSDHVDGVISKNVQVSGDVVNMKKTGTYKIHYDCKDAAGNKAPRVTRTVVVQDTTCPTCAVTGAKHITREASFTYSDAGAKCTDSLDGSLKVNVKGSVNTETTGTYKLTYSATDKSGNSNTGAKSCKSRQGAVVRTVTVKDTLKPVIALHFGGKKIHESAANDKGSNGQRNPAQDKFMAETSSVNGWIVGAIASAVAGVALLALGSKQTVTSVPV
jgi:hypothetical protein